MSVYSFSQINTYLQCPLKYRYQYIDKIPRGEEEQSPHLLLWSAVHYALEMLYKKLNQFQKPTEDELVKIFESYREKNKSADIVFPDHSPETVFLTRGRMYLMAYYNKHKPFDDTKVVMTEGKIVFSLDDDKQLKFRGVIDRLDKVWNSFIINDYKTNQQLPTEDKEHYKEQLTLYALWVQEKYGKYYENIKARLYFLHFDIVDEWHISDKDVKKVSKKYTNIVKEIEEKRFHFNMGNDDAFPPKESALCKWCEYMSICPLRSHMHMDDEVVVGDKTIKGIVDEYVEVWKKMWDLKKEKEGLKDIINTYLQKKKLKKLFGEKYQISASVLKNYAVKDLERLEVFLKKKGVLEEYKLIDRFALRRGIKEGDLSLEDLDGIVEEKESVTLRWSQIKWDKK